MPRFYVDFQDGTTFHKDVEGSDLRDAETARKEAITLLPAVAGDTLPDGEHRTFVATVRDRMGNPIYRATLTFHGERLAMDVANDNT